MHEGMDITRSETEVATDVGPMRAFVAEPAQRGSFPGVLVLHDVFGLTDHVRSVTERLAAEGYVAAAPDLRHGRSPAQIEPSQISNAVALARAIPEAAFLADVESARRHLAERERVTGRPLGAMGLGLGGRLALRAAAGGRFQAVVAFYGGRTPQTVEDSPELDAGTAVLFLVGEEDPACTSGEVANIEATFVSAGIDCECVTYPGAGDRFFCDDVEVFDQESAEDAWERVRWHFGRTLL